MNHSRSVEIIRGPLLRVLGLGKTSTETPTLSNNSAPVQRIDYLDK
jgi:hypothetical protein